MKRAITGILVVFAMAVVSSAGAETYLYDPTGQLQRVIQSDGPAAGYSYDSGGNISGAGTTQPKIIQIGTSAVLSLPLTPFANSSSTGFSATADLSALGGSSTTILNDMGVNGDAVAGDGIYSTTLTPGAGVNTGNYLLPVVYTDDQGRSGSDYLSVNVTAASGGGGTVTPTDTPTLPEWGVILLGVFLMLIAARSLPKSAASLWILGAGMTLLSFQASAQQNTPGWQNVPMNDARSITAVGPDTVTPSSPTSSGGLFGLQTLVTQFQALTVPQTIDAEIASLAAALSAGGMTGEDASAKAVRIFNWVHNTIDYQQYYGERKGSALTMLEGSGNDFDQSVLLADLLVAAGYPSANVKLRLRGQAVDYTDMVDWIGLSAAPYPGKTFQQVYGVSISTFWGGHDQGAGDLVSKQALFASQFLLTRGASGVALWYPTLPAKATVVFNRLCVQLTVNGTVYDLDPSYKTYQSTTATNDILGAVGYNRATLLATAGGAGDANSVSGLNQTNVATYLSGLTTNLLSQLAGTWQTLSVNNLANGRQIIPQTITNLSQAFPLGRTFYGTNVTFSSSADSTLAPYKTTLRFQSPGGMDYTISTSELKGRKVTLTFTNNTEELRLDDAAPVATATVTALTNSLTMTVTHPGSVGTNTETKTYRKDNNFAYSLLYGFSPSGRLIQKRYQQLRSYVDAGLADTSREVRTELLNIMGLTWLYQTELAENFISQQNNVLYLAHHRIGRMAQEEGFYVDVGLQLAGIYPNDTSPNDSGASMRFDNLFHLGSLFGSAMEHGIIEQMQPGSSAVSTVNILRKANGTSGNALLLARAANWSTVQSLLVNYTAQQKTDFGNLISTNGAQLFLPKNASVTQGIWTGSGWVIRSSNTAGMIISGGYSGGYATAKAPVVSPPIVSNYTANPVTTYTAPSIPAQVSVPPAPSAPHNYASDPVDMATGGFTYNANDISTGVEGAPRGLSFSRHYSSSEAAFDSQHLGFGWSHNFDIRATTRTAAEETLGKGTPQGAAAFLISTLVASDLYRADASPKEWGVAALTVGWFQDGEKNNAVSIRIGKDVYQFLGQSDGSYLSPPGSTMTLSKAGDGTYSLKQRLGNTIQFDTNGRAAKILDVDGKELDISYTTNDTIDFVKDSNSRRYTFGYDTPGGHITSITDSTARMITLSYDGNTNLITETDPEGKVTHYDYTVSGDPGNSLASDHHIVRIRNHDGQTITQSIYDSLGRVSQQYLHGDSGKTFSLYYTGSDNYEVNPAGGVTHFYYDTRGRATGKLDPSGNLSITGYDVQDQIISQTDGSGETTSFAYDGFHNVTRIDYPRGGGSTFIGYDGLQRLSATTNPNGVVTAYTYYTSGNDAGKDRPQSIIEAQGTADQATTSLTYNQSDPGIGRVATITDPDGLVTTKTYDGNGQPYQTKEPGGFTTTSSYTARGDLDYLLDPNGTKTQFSYNLRRQRIQAVADVGGIAATQTSSYDNEARLASSTDPADNGGLHTQQSFTYSPTDKLLTETLSGVQIATHAYDSRNWELSVTDALGLQNSMIRQGNGWLQQLQRPATRNTTLSYDGAGRIISAKNPGNNGGAQTTLTSYATNSGAPRDIFTDSDGGSLISDYDHLGHLRFLHDKRSNVFEFRYDNLARPIRLITPSTATSTTTYTKDGRIASQTEPSGDSAIYNYNATTGRLASILYSKSGSSSSNSATVNFTGYDNNGRLLALSEGSGVITRTYDSLGRVTSYNGPNGSIGYQYYPSGRLATLIYPGGSASGTGHVEYTYDSSGRIYQVIDKLDSTSSPRTTTYTWRNDGHLTSITRPNGTVRSIGYDGAARPNSISETLSGTTLLNYSITNYPNDQIASVTITPAIAPGSLATVPASPMSYDSANRITSFAGSSVLHDADGNMTFGPLPPNLVSTNSAARAITFGTYGYDSRNRLTSAGGLTYSYDPEGNRIGITGTALSTSFVIDSSGGSLPRIIQRTKNGITTRYVYGPGNLGLQYEVNSSGAATYYHYDQVGNTTALTDQSGAIVERVAYSPYGLIRYRQSNFDTPFLYGGFWGVMSDVNGLINMRARYYNPLTMRFVSSDPAHDGWNWYRYANGDPVAGSDPSGLGASRDLSNGGASYLGFSSSPNIANTTVNGVYSSYGTPQPLNNNGEGAPVGAVAAMLPLLTPIGEARVAAEGAELMAGAVAKTAPEDLTYLYQKLGSAGEHLKFGITKNPTTRYTTEELGGGNLNIIASGPKKDMLQLERNLHETLPIGSEEGQKFYIQKQIQKGLIPPPYN